MTDRAPGFYWLRTHAQDEWTVGQCYGGDHWTILGYRSFGPGSRR